jgi:hypothetical protein
MTGVLGTREFPQLLLTMFCISFPVFVAIPFFWILAIKPWVFYAPKDYGHTVDPQSYIDAMSRKTDIRLVENTNRFIKDLPSLIEKSVQNNKELEALVGTRDTQVHNTGEKVSDFLIKSISDHIVEYISNSELVKVDIAEFEGAYYKFPFQMIRRHRNS